MRKYISITNLLKLLLKLVFIFIISSCSKNNSCDIKDIDFSYKAYIDESNQYDINDLDQIIFKTLNDLDLGFYKGTLWIKIDIINSGAYRKELVVRNNDKVNRNYQFFKWDESNNELIFQNKNVDEKSNDERSFNFPKPNFKIDIEPEEHCILYIRTKSDGKVVHATPYITSLDEFIEIMNQETISNIFFYGATFIILLINFFYWVVSRKNIYGIYTLYILFTGLVYYGLDGYMYGHGFNKNIINHLTLIFYRGSILCMLLFSALFLNTIRTSPRFYKFLKYYSWIIIIGISICQVVFFRKSSGSLHIFENTIGFSWLLLLLTMIFISIKEKRPETKYYLLALFCCVGFIIIAIINSRISTGITDNSLFKIGTTLESIIFTYTTAMILGKNDIKVSELKIDLAEKEKNYYYVREKYMQHKSKLEETNKKLESKVKEINSNNNIEKTDYLAIFKLLESNLTSNKDWDDFKEKFEELNPTFLPKLYKKHPKLSKTDIRLLTLVKIGFTQKEISSILFIAESSVKKAKQRVRKKMSITCKITLVEYLSEF